MDNISIPEYLQPGFGQGTCFVKGNSLLEHTCEVVAIDYIFQFYVCRIIPEIETYLHFYTLVHRLHCKSYVLYCNRVQNNSTQTMRKQHNITRRKSTSSEEIE